MLTLVADVRNNNLGSNNNNFKFNICSPISNSNYIAN